MAGVLGKLVSPAKSRGAPCGAGLFTTGKICYNNSTGNCRSGWNQGDSADRPVCDRIWQHEKSVYGDCMPLRMRVHDREPIGLALRRFKKLLERSGIQKELRKRKYYEKPCEARRRAELRKQSAIRKAKTGGIRKP